MSQNRVFNYRFIKPDPAKDFKFKAIVPLEPQAPLPAEMNLTVRPNYPAIYDQGQVGSCTGNAGSAVKEQITRKYKPDYPATSRLGFYYCERDLDGTTGSDAGSDGKSSAEVLMRVGIGPESMWPYIEAKVFDRPTEDYYREAANHKIGAYYFFNHDTRLMQQCLANGYGFVFGLWVPRWLMEPAFNGFVTDPSKHNVFMDGGQKAGHQLSCFGYRRIKGILYFLVRNSWGVSWPPKKYNETGLSPGHFWLDARFLQSPQWTDNALTYRLAKEPGI